MKYFSPSTSLLSEPKFYSFFSFDGICGGNSNVDGNSSRHDDFTRTATFYENPHEYGAMHPQPEVDVVMESRDPSPTLSKPQQKRRQRRHRGRHHHRQDKHERHVRIETVLSVSDLMSEKQKHSLKPCPTDSPTASLSSMGTASTCSSHSSSNTMVRKANAAQSPPLPKSILRTSKQPSSSSTTQNHRNRVRFASNVKENAPKKETRRERRRRLKNSLKEEKLLLTSSYLTGFAMGNGDDMGGSLYSMGRHEFGGSVY